MVDSNGSKNVVVPFRCFKLSFDALRIGKPYRLNDPTALVQEIYPQ